MQNITIVITIILLLASEIVLGQTAKKWVLLEQFTNTLCPACGNRNPELHEMILKEYDTDVIHISYHNNRPLQADPFYQSNPIPANIRTEYYEITASPGLVLNGVKLQPEKPLITPEKLEQHLNQSSPLHLTIQENIQTNKERQIEISINSVTELPNATYKLFVAVAEKEVIFCTYFEYVFDNVFRTFLSGNRGDEITLNSNEKKYTYNYTPKSEWKEEELFVIAFVQNIETKEIINAIATQPLNTNKTVRYADDAFSLLSTIADDVCGENKGSVELDICIDAAPIADPVDLSFSWSNGATTQNIYNLSEGIYVVKITNNVKETTTEQQYEIKGNEKINVTVNVQADTGSSDGAIRVHANGGSGELSIDWNTNDDIFNLNALQAGLYTFTVSDENGCTTKQTVEVKSELIIGEAAVKIQHISCSGKNDGSIAISTNGDIPIDKVIWLMDDKTGNNLEGLSAGNYTFFTVNEAGDKMHEGSFVIKEPAPLELTTKQSNGFEEPYINVEQVLGGTAPYFYNWSNGSTDTQIINIEPGTYSLQISDQNGCILDENFTIVQNTIKVQSISCFGANDGAIEIIVNDGNQYVFNWTNGETEPIINDLSAGRYGITLSDQDFSKFLNFDIIEPKLIELSLVYDSLKNVIQPKLRGGTAPYQFLWNNGALSTTLENATAGSFSLVVTDANNCEGSAEIEIASFTSISALVFSPLEIYPNPIETWAFIDLPFSSKNRNVKVFDANGVGRSIPFSINQSRLQFDFTGFPAGVYLLQLTDEDNKIYYVAKALRW